MVRTIVFVTAGALTLSAVLIGPSTAKAAVTGSVSCTLSGSAAISPGLPLLSPGKATKKVKTTVTFNGTLSNCTGTQSGTKNGAQIDAGSVVAVGKTVTAVGQDLPSCGGLAAPTTLTVLKATVLFTSAGKTVAKSKANLTIGASIIDLTTGIVTFPASGAVSGGNAFKGQTLTTDAVLDDDFAGLAALCTGGASTTFEFTGVKGASTLDIPQ